MSEQAIPQSFDDPGQCGSEAGRAGSGRWGAGAPHGLVALPGGKADEPDESPERGSEAGLENTSLEDALGRGLIPAAPAVRVLEGLISPYNEEYRVLDRLRGQQYADFDTVDRLLCHVGIPWPFVQDKELRRLYDVVSLKPRPFREKLGPQSKMRTCRCPGCSEKFEETPQVRKAGKTYCSTRCRKKHGRIRLGQQPPVHMASVAKEEFGSPRYMCRNGKHEASPENTYYIKTGDGRTVRTCRPCKLEAQRAYDRRKAAKRPYVGKNRDKILARVAAGTATPEPPRTFTAGQGRRAPVSAERAGGRRQHGTGHGNGGSNGNGNP